MVVGNAPEAADFVVIGGGPGGYTAALHAAQQRRKVLLIDSHGDDGIGGVCLNAGCIPSKTLIESADLVYRSQNSGDMGISTSDAHLDLPAWQQFKSSVINRLSGGVRQKLKAAGVEIAAGNAMFTDAKTLVIATSNGQARFVQFRDCIIATGSDALTLPGFEFGEDILDAQAALSLQSIPSTMAIVGAGYIGLELGCAFAKLGCKVTVVEAQDRILPAMPKAIAPVLQQSMISLGVDFKLSHLANSYADGQLMLSPRDAKTTTVAAEKLLIAIGRRPNTGQLGLDAIGISPDEQGLLTVAPDRRLIPHIAAIGDITSGPALAHKASAEAIVAVDALCGTNTAFEPQAIPLIVFTDPEIAMAGLTGDEAKDQGIEVKTLRLPMKASGRATTMNQTEGYVELLADANSGILLGATIVGPHASELIASICVAIEMAAAAEDIALTIHAHPTLGELTMDCARALTQSVEPSSGRLM